MDFVSIVLVGLLIFGIAVLYSSVGHGGASGYLAAMALWGLGPEMMKPTALVLNILVAGLATIKFYRAGCFAWSLFWPFAVASVPSAFVGGAIMPSRAYYDPVVGLVLLVAATALLPGRAARSSGSTRPVPLGLALVAGGAIGLLSGLTGVGGGIFLSPLLVLARWAQIRQTAAVSAPFILVNSIAGLSGHLASVWQVPFQAAWWGLGALAGAWIGTELGSHRLSTAWLRRALALVLAIAGVKMILT